MRAAAQRWAIGHLLRTGRALLGRAERPRACASLREGRRAHRASRIVRSIACIQGRRRGNAVDRAGRCAAGRRHPLFPRRRVRRGNARDPRSAARGHRPRIRCARTCGGLPARAGTSVPGRDRRLLRRVESPALVRIDPRAWCSAGIPRAGISRSSRRCARGTRACRCPRRSCCCRRSSTSRSAAGRSRAMTASTRCSAQRRRIASRTGTRRDLTDLGLRPRGRRLPARRWSSAAPSSCWTIRCASPPSSATNRCRSQTCRQSSGDPRRSRGRPRHRRDRRLHPRAHRGGHPRRDCRRRPDAGECDLT